MRPAPKAKAMAGVKLPPKPPAAKPPAAAGAAPPAVMRELRRLREATARLEKDNALSERREQIRKGRALLQRGLREGKLTPRMIGSPQKPTHTRSFAMRDPKGFAQWLAKEAPVVVEFRERGTTQAEDANSAPAQAMSIDKLARALMEKDANLDYSTATRQVLESNRSLSERYDRAVSGNAGPREIRVVSNRSGVR
jgi:hypothetical protein